MRVLMQVTLVLAVLGILEGLYYLWRYLVDRRADQLRDRLQAMGERNVDAHSLLRAERLSDFPVVRDILASLPFTRSFELLIEQSGLDLSVARLLLYAALLAVGCGAVGTALQLGAGLSLLVGIIAAVVPFGFLLMLRSTRSQKMSEQMPDALDMMSRSLRAGHALEHSFKLVATEAPTPINIEFGRAFEEQRLGRTLEQSVLGIVRRVPNNADLKILATSIAVQKETGGNLAEILEKIAETIRTRYRFYGKLDALTAEGRLSGIVLGALPIATFLFMLASNRAYVSLLFTTPTGNWMLVAAVVCWLLGLFWLFRMAKVQF